jgi:hypothetical protein
VSSLPVFVSQQEYEGLVVPQRYKYVRWNDKTFVLSDEWKKMIEHAKELAKEAKVYNIATTETRSWYEDTYTATVVNWYDVARLIHHVIERERKQYEPVK